MSNVSDSNLTKMYTERQVLAEMLIHFKERPCLWNPQHELYNHKPARERGFMELLEKYQLIDENATIEQVKKKMEHMRCAYRRERRKVLNARQNGLDHRPCLWYFDYLTFLNDDVDMNSSRDSMKHETVVTYLQENEDGEYEFEEVPNKKAKIELLSAASSSPRNSNYDTGNENVEQDDQEQSIAQQEAEAFGKTIGLQLRELNSTQRFIAEKLISDIIFYARLDQLKVKSSIVIDTD